MHPQKKYTHTMTLLVERKKQLDSYRADLEKRLERVENDLSLTQKELMDVEALIQIYDNME